MEEKKLAGNSVFQQYWQQAARRQKKIISGVHVYQCGGKQTGGLPSGCLL